jgi:hypothetical protein
MVFLAHGKDLQVRNNDSGPCLGQMMRMNTWTASHIQNSLSLELDPLASDPIDGHLSHGVIALVALGGILA